MIALRKASRQMDYGLGGFGTSIHMSGAMFTQLTGTDIVIFRTRKRAALTDLLAGRST